MSRVTINEIAAMSGVSKGAVSYALNGRPGVSEVTRERILRVARDLGWAPNRTARMLSGSRTDTFGLVILEAMACGKAVVSSTAGSLPEVVGDAGLYFDPLDVEAMALALRRVVDEPALRVSLAACARRRASLFTWESAARSLFETFESLVPPDRPSGHRGDDRRKSA